MRTESNIASKSYNYFIFDNHREKNLLESYSIRQALFHPEESRKKSSGKLIRYLPTSGKAVGPYFLLCLPCSGHSW